MAKRYQDMRRNLALLGWFYPVIFGVLFASLATQAQSASEAPLGIAALHHVSKKAAHSLASSNVRPLLTAADQVSFLEELEGEAPNWALLQDQPDEEMGERLFAFNRQRDQAREGHALLEERVVFLWSGILRQYVPEYRGFTVALGPDLTETAWGVVRFKPMALPQEMIAIPPPGLRPTLQRELAQGEKVEIKILFAGHLIPEESIIYAFSHEDVSQGMIIPVVQTEEVQYFLPLSKEH